MDFLQQIKDLASKGITIDFQHDHYPNGINCNWSIRFTVQHEEIKIDDEILLPASTERRGTMWHGDNHEFGDPHESMQAAVKLAYFMSENADVMEAYYNRFPTMDEHSEGRRKLSEFMKTLYK